MLLLIPLATATLPMCEDKVEINTNCTMVTPVINYCSAYNYSIYNTSGTLTTNGVLTNLTDNTGIYYFNFTETEGDYIIQLCDNTTREVRVKEDDGDAKMIIAAVILLPMILAALLMFVAFGLSDEHKLIKTLLYFLVPVLFFTSMHFSAVSLVKFFNFPELEEAIGSTVYWFGIIMFVIISYVCVYVIYRAFEYMRTNKQEKMEL